MRGEVPEPAWRPGREGNEPDRRRRQAVVPWRGQGEECRMAAEIPVHLDPLVAEGRRDLGRLPSGERHVVEAESDPPSAPRSRAGHRPSSRCGRPRHHPPRTAGPTSSRSGRISVIRGGAGGRRSQAPPAGREPRPGPPRRPPSASACEPRIRSTRRRHDRPAPRRARLRPLLEALEVDEQVLRRLVAKLRVLVEGLEDQRLEARRQGRARAPRRGEARAGSRL